MSERIAYHPYKADFVSPPGDTLLEMLEERGMTQTELSERMGRPQKTINGIIKGHKAITAETALQLERVFRVPARFWLGREQDYREYLARQVADEELDAQVPWLDNFPLAKMKKLGWLPTGQTRRQLLIDVLQFFGIAHPESWPDIWESCLVNYRQAKTFASDDYALSAWLRQGEIEAQEIYTAPYDAQRFEALLHNEIRALTNLASLAEIRTQLTALCADVGVAVALVPQVDGARLSGAARWLHKEKALIQLSLRYKSNDTFWFTFFHEAGHILLHGKRDVFLDTKNLSESRGEKEIEANRFAANVLIPAVGYDAFVRGMEINSRYVSNTAVVLFAEKINIHPGIVVGRLQYDGKLPKSHLNKLKIPFDWSDIAMEAV